MGIILILALFSQPFLKGFTHSMHCPYELLQPSTAKGRWEPQNTHKYAWRGILGQTHSFQNQVFSMHNEVLRTQLMSSVFPETTFSHVHITHTLLPLAWHVGLRLRLRVLFHGSVITSISLYINLSAAELSAITRAALHHGGSADVGRERVKYSLICLVLEKDVSIFETESF